jgi:hypothetical protein
MQICAYCGRENADTHSWCPECATTFDLFSRLGITAKPKFSRRRDTFLAQFRLPQPLLALALLAFPVWFIALLSLYPCENYCFLYPSIDTTYAPQFSERQFKRVRPGDTAESVTARLGQPLKRYPLKAGGEIWYYSRDGKCKWGDYAWLLRRVEIRDGTVTKVTRQVINN